MDIRTAFQVPSRADLSRPKCPSCGSVLLLAEHSAFMPKGRVRHAWSCDDCGHEFVTSIRVLPRQLSG
jgi:ribosomal protein S27AE